MNKFTFFLGIIAFSISGCYVQKKVDVVFFKGAKKHKETVYLNFISDSGTIVSPYINSVKFGYLDSLSFPDGNPDNMQSYITYRPLNFRNRIKPYSPEYYAVYAIYNIEVL